MSTSLEDALNGQTSDPVPEAPAEPEAKEPEELAAPEPEVDPIEEQPPAEPEPSEDEAKGWQYAAYKDEKSKRQELEKTNSDMQAQLAEIQRQNAEYQNYLNQLREQQQQQEDPQGAQVQQLVTAQVGQVEARMRLNTSRTLAVNAHGQDKVAAAEKAFEGLRQSDPATYDALYNKFGTHQDPIGQIVAWHKKHEIMTLIGDDPQAYIDAQVQAKLAELGNIPPPDKPNGQPAPVMPTDLSQTRNVGSRTGSNWTGPTDLSSALGENS